MRHLKEATTAHITQKQRRDYDQERRTPTCIAGYRTNVDWMVYDAFSAIRLIEERRAARARSKFRVKW